MQSNKTILGKIEKGKTEDFATSLERSIEDYNNKRVKDAKEVFKNFEEKYGY